MGFSYFRVFYFSTPNLFWLPLIEDFQAHVHLDWSKLGYLTRESSKVGFYLNECAVHSCTDKSQAFPLVGGFLGEKCLLPKTLLDIGQILLYRSESTWSRSDAYLEFRVFKRGFTDIFCIDLNPDEAFIRHLNNILPFKKQIVHYAICKRLSVSEAENKRGKRNSEIESGKSNFKFSTRDPAQKKPLPATRDPISRLDKEVSPFRNRFFN